MKTFTSFRYILWLAALLSLAACGKELRPTSQQNNSQHLHSCNGAVCDHDPGEPTVDDTKSLVEATVAGGIFNDQKVIEYDPDTKMITFSVPLPVNPFGVEFQGQL